MHCFSDLALTTPVMSALFVNQLSTIDFSYLCSKRGLVGETWLVDVILTGELNNEGMVFDFGHVKKEIKAMIDVHADHALLVPEQHPDITVENHGDTREVTMIFQQGKVIHCKAPKQAILPMPLNQITTEGVRPLLEAYIKQGVPKNVTGVELNLYPQAISETFYHYSHGLKKHKGDCQHIAHGHRSPIRIFVDTARREDLEQKCADEWKDIYIATREDLQSTAKINGHLHNTFSYLADQGRFELQIPAEQCYLIDTDTTVELMATYLSKKLAQQIPGSNVKVIAYEGFNKGAIACCNEPL